MCFKDLKLKKLRILFERLSFGDGVIRKTSESFRSNNCDFEFSFESRFIETRKCSPCFDWLKLSCR